MAHALLAAGLLAWVALLIDPPVQGDRAGLYPACPIYFYLGILCPGCGATRALSALLHGHLIEAIRWNALFVLLLPGALAGAAESYRRALRRDCFSWPELPAPAVYGTLAAALIFTLARNLPH